MTQILEYFLNWKVRIPNFYYIWKWKRLNSIEEVKAGELCSMQSINPLACYVSYKNKWLILGSFQTSDTKSNMNTDIMCVFFRFFTHLRLDLELNKHYLIDS